tara:strand:- start:277 stop:432 length:156 start_codon:yes stop_codon:yes gene_type:complete
MHSRKKISKAINDARKVAFDLKIKKTIKKQNLKEFDEWFAKLIAKNGTTNY